VLGLVLVPSLSFAEMGEQEGARDRQDEAGHGHWRHAVPRCVTEEQHSDDRGRQGLREHYGTGHDRDAAALKRGRVEDEGDDGRATFPATPICSLMAWTSSPFREPAAYRSDG